MRRRSVNPRIALLALMLASAAALAACADDGGKAADGGRQDETARNEAPAQDDSRPEDGGTDEGAQPVTKEGYGVFVGWIDAHSVEIEVGGTPIAFRIGEGASAALEGIDSNDPVRFRYTEEPVEGDDTLKLLTITEIARAEGAEAGAGDLPETKELEVELEGTKETRTASKAVGSGYAIYVFPQFAFDPETNRMSMNVDPEYYVEIARLPAGWNPDEVRAEGEAWVKEGTGTVEEWTDDRIYEPMRGASLYLHGQKTGLTRTFVVKTIDGADYALKFNQPQREASEGFLPLAFASVNSIVTIGE
ncbi:hypothetical protein [Thermobacillus sp. ZCTH02-B1]|uniref:hypothetical protein n=1 Tax=Thermobacillus sp. ZCTH02-B1 TaxID=1858795 RepID=UPI0026003B15|nr:hypothetical protein [Thermobacillus sp. ZCTH02-B1]